MQIQSDDPRRSDVVALLQDHQAIAREHGDPDTVHAFDRDELSADNVHFFSARGEGHLLGIGALLCHASWHYEIKSMHTSNLARRTGVATALVDHLVKVAREFGATRVSLATGTMDAMAPARTLYRRLGFVECEPFAEYSANDINVHMTLEL